ncbi:hypothetical protein [Desulfohalobium retbaense]|uniref:Uncharacterized protein n=1 Tax=Desulfohalobium retbaense (strain ATCC 49708 / DSM 5692 / JCM 16813 / HR100) TaxID=485915 RepID=C8X3A4_DESRD|nr:hypothetical protein [Desulfohalobium retbaense]ACV68901.1 conserved hypothetical protein [Desulfohalobium retbaense DSM 5692]
MTSAQAQQYQSAVALWALLRPYSGLKLQLDCGHHVTLCPGHPLVNDIVIRQSARRLVCPSCAYTGM